MSDLIRVRELAETLKRLEGDVDAAEQSLKDAKAALYAVQCEELPDLMAEVGMADFTFAETGERIVIEGKVDAAITDETRPRALAWLLENGFGGLIKTKIELAFGRGEREAAEKVRENLAETHDDVITKEEVHHSTLRSFVKERIESGEPLPLDLFNARPYNKAVLKAAPKPKKKRATRK